MTGPLVIEPTISVVFPDHPDITFTCGTLADAERVEDNYRTLGIDCQVVVELRALVGDAALSEMEP